MFHVCMKLSSRSETITYPAPPITNERVNRPPGTSSGIFEDEEEPEYLSDQDIAAGRTPNNTRTTQNQPLLASTHARKQINEHPLSNRPDPSIATFSNNATNLGDTHTIIFIEKSKFKPLNLLAKSSNQVQLKPPRALA